MKGAFSLFLEWANIRTNCYIYYFQLYHSVAWSPDGQYLAVGTTNGSNDLTIYSWNGQTLETLITASIAYVNSVAWSPNGQNLAVGTKWY